MTATMTGTSISWDMNIIGSEDTRVMKMKYIASHRRKCHQSDDITYFIILMILDFFHDSFRCATECGATSQYHGTCRPIEI